ncbi:homeobox protein BEL1 homolog [Andrographis paniculata]|uniref:homeobox protein BEL1 homolog n=1 Tax=Andrographis paniculata TaxID=175694 RepID=UPI0021E7B38A|nr:homeobox protein BEL1 homolog [Andrographis paniculata]
MSGMDGSGEDHKPYIYPNSGSSITATAAAANSLNGGNQKINENQAIIGCPDHHMVSLQVQSFEANPEIYNLTAGMEMMAYHNPTRNNDDLQQWRGFYNNHNNKISGSTSGGSDSCGGPGAANSSRELNVPTSSDDQFYHHDLTANEAPIMTSPWINNPRLVNVDQDPYSLRSCVFPCEGNERPSQGLSLSLNSSNPSRVTLQSFELRHHQQLSQQGQYYGFIRSSRYLKPAQDLLTEFCSLGMIKRSEDDDDNNDTPKTTTIKVRDDDDVAKQSLHSLDLYDLQIRKTKLIQMLEEVDRRYKHYCDQMKAVSSSFESVAGNGAASVYSAMASRTMSRHFRCLKDGILRQVKATKQVIEEKNTTVNAAGGYTMKGETPRLKLLDQKLRQQKALQQMSLMETHPWRPQRGLPERSVSALRAWLFEHFLHPYPSDVDKHILSRQTGLSRSQVSNWFINARVRLWKPMVEEMYSAELKDSAAGENPSRPINDDDRRSGFDRTVAGKDTQSLSSILNQSSADRNYSGAMELDFTSYGGGGGGVSLTLGLHQHGGVSSSSSSMFYSTAEQMEECQTVHHHYSLLENDQSQNLPYRNLMGAQLLHDLAG